MPFSFGQPVDGQAVLTHVGSVDVKVGVQWARLGFRFLCHPRAGEDYLSVYVGRLSLDEAVSRITLQQSPSGRPGDAVRYAIAESLIRRGFTLTHEPDACEEHAAVKYGSEWTEDVAKSFDNCFQEHIRYCHG